MTVIFRNKGEETQRHIQTHERRRSLENKGRDWSNIAVR